MDALLLDPSSIETSRDGAPASSPPVVKVVERSVYRGPNIHSLRAMVRVRVEIGPLELHPASAQPGLTDGLLALLPGLALHHCSKGRPGGFVERLREGTWYGHVVEHVALELQVQAGTPVSRGKTRSVRSRPGTYDILVEYRDENVALLALRHALVLTSRLLPAELGSLDLGQLVATSSLDDRAAVGDMIAEIAALARRTAFGPSTQALVDAARRRGIPVTRLDEQSLVQLGFGSRQHKIRASITGNTSHIAVETAGNKQLTRQLLLDAALPAPRGVVVRSLDQARAQARRFRGPLVVKPVSANHGRGVTLNVDANSLPSAFATARAHGTRIIIEEQLPGEDHRFLVVGGRVVAVARRRPASVIGDGIADVATLVARANDDPRRGSGHENVLTRLVIDDAATAVLAAQGLAPGSVPSRGLPVRLRDTANLSTGGTAEDCTDDVHPDNIFVVEQAAATIGLDVAGIDFLSPDIARPVAETGGGIVEINAAPGLRMHLAPSSGTPRDVAAPIVDHLFPRPRDSRIPIVAITGTNGKSTTARMVARILRETVRTVGLTSTSGIYINERLIRSADASGPKSARQILANPTVDVAVFETARGGILREGLGFDRCDVGCVLNVTEDHLGLKGIDTVDDLANVKSVVIEAVKRRGVSVLNADDARTRRMRRHARGRICWFSMHGLQQLVADHVTAGGDAVVLEADGEKDAIVIYRGRDRTLVTTVDHVPATQKGAAGFNVENALAATAIAAGLGVAVDAIATGLAGFTTSYEDSPGRLNIIDRYGVTVIVDYAHNPAAVTALGKFLATLRQPGRRFIGTYSVPGDRRDEDLIGMGTLAASLFDELVFRETPDGRGRPRGEINALMSSGAIAGGMAESRIHRIVEEGAATLFALNLARPGDVVVISPTQIDLVWELVSDFTPARPRADHD
ncbi:cyanophycin synthetase [Sphingomonas panacisoli]|uniref:cyanophycin synthetase n=1 Tax=Sphingomonas panacisoli TaxID=1813879 RepID=UPI003B846B07